MLGYGAAACRPHTSDGRPSSAPHHTLHSEGYKPGDSESRMDGRAGAEAGPPLSYLHAIYLEATVDYNHAVV